MLCVFPCGLFVIFSFFSFADETGSFVNSNIYYSSAFEINSCASERNIRVFAL